MGLNHGIGDLAKGIAIRRQNLVIKTETFSAGQTMAAGERNSMDVAQSGESSKLSGLQRELNLLEEFGRATSQVRTKYETVQLALDQIRNETSETVLTVMTEIGQSQPALPRISAAEAEHAVRSVVSTLNRSVSGSSLFSGAATDQPAITDVNQLLSDVEMIVNNAPDALSARVAIDFYFDDAAGGFRTGIYSGSISNTGPVEVARNETVQLDLRADSDELRDVLKSLVTIYASVNATGGPPDHEKVALLKESAEDGLSANQSLVSVQQHIGSLQEKLKLTSEKNELMGGILSTAKSDIISVDLYEMASRFQEMQVQLEAAYQVTARLSSLSISKFM